MTSNTESTSSEDGSTTDTDDTDPSDEYETTTAPGERAVQMTDEDGTHVLDIDDLAPDEIASVLDRAATVKAGEEEGRLADRTLALLFEQPSTRTRVSFEAGMSALGGTATFLGPGETHLERGEPVRDVARALSRYVDAIAARVERHETLVELATYADVPVINALSDRAHPCQTLADLLTIRESVGPLDSVTAAWVGDGNNVGASFALGCAITGVDLTVATPAAHGLSENVLDRADALGGAPTVTNDPEAAIEGADVVYTDVWVSMSDDADRDEKLADFDGFQLNESLLSAAPDAAVLHCMPAHRGEEIAEDVLEGDRELIWDQTENRMHVQNALLLELLNG